MPKNLERKGGLKLDPAVKDWLKDAARNPAALTKKQRRDRARSRATYDLSKEVQEAVQLLAKEMDTSASQVAEMLLWYAIHHYRMGSRELADAFDEGRRPARTPRFSWNYDPPEAWQGDGRAAEFKRYWGLSEE